MIQPHSGAQMKQERDGKPEQPAGDEDRLPSVAVGQRARGEVGQCLGHAEGQDERQDRGEGGQTEDLASQQRQDGPLQSDHPAEPR